MDPPDSHPSANEYPEDVALAVLMRYIYQTHPALFPSLPEDPASPSEQSATTRCQGANASDLATFNQELPHTEETVAGPSDLANDLECPTPDPYLSSHDSETPPHPFYGTPTAETDYYRTETDFPFYQPHATQLPPLFHPHDPTPHHTGVGINEHPYQQYNSPATHHDQNEGYCPSSSATLNYNHEFYDAIPSRSLDLNRTYPPHPDVVRSGPAFDYTTWESSTVASEAGPSGTTDPSVSGHLDGTGKEEATELPKGSPPPGTSNIESHNPKKRKRPDSRGGVRRKHARHSRSQHHDNPQRMLIQPTPSSQPRPSNLRLARQDDYVCGNNQKWVKLPDIVFKVGGVDGIRLTEAMNIYFNGPDDRDELMFADGNFGSSFSCRIRFEGYPASEDVRPISTWNYKTEKARTTKKKLAEYTAKRINTYLQELADAGTPYPVPSQDMVITRLIHVSKASFQPEIRY